MTNLFLLRTSDLLTNTIVIASYQTIVFCLNSLLKIYSSHSVQKISTLTFYRQPSLYGQRTFLYVFFWTRLWLLLFYEITPMKYRIKHKNKLMKKSCFFISKKSQNITWFFWKKFDLILNNYNLYSKKKLKEK